VSRNIELLLRWMPRALGIVVCGYIALFATDSFSNELPLAQRLRDFGIHLIPALVLVAVVVLSWRREWIGGSVFAAAALAYAYFAHLRPSWVLVISGPLVVGAILYFAGWFARVRTLRAR
jgi:hypothetical protein